MEKRKALIDLDGTCIQFKHTYHQCCWDCGIIISRVFGVHSPSPLTVLELQRDIDGKMLNGNFGLHDTRFPLSWVRTYSQLSNELGQPIQASVCDEITAAARKFQDGPWPLVPNILETLVWLRNAGYEIIILTAGPKWLQEKKVNDCGLWPYVDKVIPTPKDKTALMAKAVGKESSRSFMLGDSRGSDLVPALALGITGIWLRNTTTWSPADAPLDPKTHYTIHGPEQLPALLECIHHER